MAFPEVHYYTVRLENKKVFEFVDFHKRMGKCNAGALAELARYLQNLGKSPGGALGRNFQTSIKGERIPPCDEFIESDDPYNCGLCLCTVRVSSSAIILLNGDKKTVSKGQDCKICSPHFDLAKRLRDAVRGAILINKLELDNNNKGLIINDSFITI